MIEALILRLDAPLMSFGATMVDRHGVIQDFPGLSMLTGLVANALGYRHRDVGRLMALQERLRFAARRDRRGERLVDFQTAYLGQEYLREGWTTRRAPESRGGETLDLTHIRNRHFWADAIFTVVLALEPPDESPTLGEIELALGEPARPLFLGRKACLPSGPLVVGRTTGASFLEIVENASGTGKRQDDGRLAAWLPVEGDGGADGDMVSVTDERDWANQVHVGRRWVRATTVVAPEETNA